VSTGTKPTIIVTGISGNLGLRVLKLLEDFNVIGVDMTPPRTDLPVRYENVDLGREAACRQLVKLLRETNARAVVHLAFVIDPLRTGILDRDRMWQINVAGTARVMEAITEVNRSGGQVDTFIFPSSVSAYGPETYGPVKEDHPLGAHTLPYAIHKHEADDVVRLRAPSLGSCVSYILRPHIFTGATMQNYLVGALRGTPTGKGKWAVSLRTKGKRLPLLCPGRKSRESRFQFVHVDDMARLIAYILRKPVPEQKAPVILNVAGRGEAITLEYAAHIANAKVVQVPGRWIMRLILRLLWDMGISGVPPEATPYMIGSYIMDTSRLKKFLGKDYETVIRYTVVDALKDCFHDMPETQSASAARSA
jgi:UDP-glucose 4-epimerase